MPTYLESYAYLSADAKWWPGLILKSVSAAAEFVTVSVDNEAGEQVRMLQTTLAPRQQKVLSSADLCPAPGRYSLRVTRGELVHHQLLQAGPTPFNYSHSAEIATQAIDDPLSPVQISGRLYMRYNGQTSCRYIRRKYLDVLETAALSAMMIPGRFDNVLNIGDACPLVGSCPDHPSQHSGFYGVDIDYPTVRTNLTQYRVQTVNIFELTNLWDGETLINIDRERCFELWRRLTGTTISTDPRILATVQAWAAANGKSAVDIAHVQGDVNSIQYNHHTHMHVKFNEL